MLPAITCRIICCALQEAAQFYSADARYARGVAGGLSRAVERTARCAAAMVGVTRLRRSREVALAPSETRYCLLARYTADVMRCNSEAMRARRRDAGVTRRRRMLFGERYSAACAGDERPRPYCVARDMLQYARCKRRGVCAAPKVQWVLACLSNWRSGVRHPGWEQGALSNWEPTMSTITVNVMVSPPAPPPPQTGSLGCLGNWVAWAQVHRSPVWGCPPSPGAAAHRPWYHPAARYVRENSSPTLSRSFIHLSRRRSTGVCR